jgi:acyl dehydratase
VTAVRTGAADDEVRGHLLARLGRQQAVGYVASRLVSEEAVQRWSAELPGGAVGDLRGASGPVPRPMLHSWVLPPADDAESPGWLARMREVTSEFGYTHGLATNYSHEYAADIHVGDALTSRSWVDSVSERKQTHLGPGHFVTSCIQVQRADGRVVGTVHVRNLLFRPESRGGGTGRNGTPADSILASAGPAWTVHFGRELLTGHAAASLDLDPIHHDIDTARAAGFPDVVASSLTTLALVDRFAAMLLPRHAAAAIELRLGQVLIPDDNLVLSPVPGVPGEGGSLTITGRHARGVHVTAAVHQDVGLRRPGCR